MNKSQVQSISLGSPGRSVPQGLAWTWQLDNSRLLHFWEVNPWAVCGSKIVAQRRSWGALRPGDGSVVAQGWEPQGLTPGEPAACRGQPPRDVSPGSQAEPLLCLFIPPSLTLPACNTSSTYSILTLRIGKGTYGNTWEEGWKHASWEWEVKNSLVNTSLIKVVTACTAVVVLLVVIVPVLRCICFYQSRWDQTDGGGILTNNKKQANKSLV